MGQADLLTGRLPLDGALATASAAQSGAVPPMPAATVHVVGHMTASVLSFLLPTLRTLDAAGRAQALLFIDDGATAAHGEAIPAGVVRVGVPDSGSQWRHASALFGSLQALSRDLPIGALHLHGLLPALAALRWLRRSGDRVAEVVFSPHSSRALLRGGLPGAAVVRLLSLGLGCVSHRVIVNLQPEVRLLTPLGEAAVAVVECPVPQVFFDTPRREAKRPLLISGHLDGHPAAVEPFVRVAVLLGDERLGISFNWVGGSGPEAAAALRAAGIGQFEAADDASRALRLGAAWVYVAPIAERGFPVRLVEAMATGLPCVALNTEVHRSIINDGETGFLCPNLETLLQRVADLIDASDLRQRIGDAARGAASRRFSEAAFNDALRHALGAPPARPGDTAAR